MLNQKEKKEAKASEKEESGIEKEKDVSKNLKDTRKDGIFFGPLVLEYQKKSKTIKSDITDKFLSLRSPENCPDEWEMGSKDGAKFGGSKSDGKMDNSTALAEPNKSMLKMTIKGRSKTGKIEVQRSAVRTLSMAMKLGSAGSQAETLPVFFSSFSILEKKEKKRSVGAGDHHPTVKKKGWWFWKNRGLGGGIVRVRVIACCMH